MSKGAAGKTQKQTKLREKTQKRLTYRQKLADRFMKQQIRNYVNNSSGKFKAKVVRVLGQGRFNVESIKDKQPYRLSLKGSLRLKGKQAANPLVTAGIRAGDYVLADGSHILAKIDYLHKNNSVNAPEGFIFARGSRSTSGTRSSRSSSSRGSTRKVKHTKAKNGNTGKNVSMYSNSNNSK